jgi:cytochrome c-type biogenesis protein CcmH
MSRFALWLPIAGAALLGAAACTKNVDEGEMKIGQQAAPPASMAPGHTLQGTVRIDPKLASQVSGDEVLFLIARSAQGGPAVAVERYAAPSFPMQVSLSSDSASVHGGSLAGHWLVFARLDKDGDAGALAEGDMLGATAGPVSPDGPPFEIVIDELVDAALVQAAGMAAAAQGGEAQAPAGQAAAAAAAPPPLGSEPAEGAGGEVRGLIRLHPELADSAAGRPVLFIIARPAGGGPPIAVKRVPAPSFPYEFSLGSADAMTGGQFSGQVTILARLDADGAAGPPASGDINGQTREPVAVGGPPIEIVLDDLVP